jgi:chaperonin cofactor prefoldin
MAIDSFDDLLRELEGHPEWRERLRSVVLTDRLVSLPDSVDRLVEAQTRTEARVEELAQAQTRTEARVEELAQAQTRTETRLEELAQAQTRTEASLEELTARVDQLTARVGQLTARVDQLAVRFDQLTARVDQLTARVDQLTARVEELTVQVSALTTQMAQVVTRLDRLDGDLIERQYRDRASSYFAPIASRIRVLSRLQLDELLEAAVDDGLIDAQHASEIRWADVIIRGRRQGQPVHLVVEASVGVGTHDVERAAERAAYLAQIVEGDVLAVVAGDSVITAARILAARHGVWQVTNGTVVEPEAAA